MKKDLFIILAALGLAGCSELPTDPNTPNEKGELERSYISVSLLSDNEDIVRADSSEDFEYGEGYERYVDNVHFFFFKSDESAFPVNGVSGKNYISFTMASNGTQPEESGKPNEGPNVSDVKDKVLVFDSYKGEYPAYIVAVLNWDTQHIQPSYTLNNLYNAITNIRNSNTHFVMSNAVYADSQSDVIKASRLTIENIGKSEEEALANPVEIYVERLSAKVAVVAKGDVAGKEATYNTKTSVGDVAVYAKVLKWELYNEYHQSLLLKHIHPDTWGLAGGIGFLWNDPNKYRSYWAASQIGGFPTDNHFDWLNNGLNPNGDVAYCGENTNQAEVDSNGTVISDSRTKVIVKAQLIKENGEPVEVASWFGNTYVGEQTVRKEVASLLSSQFFYASGGGFEGIDADDLKMVGGNEAPESVDVESYEVFFQLSDSALAKEWFTYSNESGYKPATSSEINTRLATVEPALVYKDGMTYYYTNIKHLGKSGSDSEYGVVRNHIYKINISEISGLGTPVFDSDININTPERPSDINTYIAAEVRILSWKVVKNNYNVK
ncbi:MAG: Mfa1 fimbrilin C-terminal domain-containing protein [Tidjanibacter sp.]|nr:Mfa1 fimbrilin C-terminal domain-containing protein [Tidjanibacter sp.]